MVNERDDFTPRHVLGFRDALHPLDLVMARGVTIKVLHLQPLETNFKVGDGLCPSLVVHK